MNSPSNPIGVIVDKSRETQTGIAYIQYFLGNARTIIVSANDKNSRA